MSGKWCFFFLSFCCFPAKCFWAAKQFASNRKVFFNQSDQFVKNWYIRCNHIAQILTSGGLEVIALWSNEQCTSKEVCILLRVNKWPRAHLIHCQGSLSLQVLCYFFSCCLLLCPSFYIWKTYIKMVVMAIDRFACVLSVYLNTFLWFITTIIQPSSLAHC